MQGVGQEQQYRYDQRSEYEDEDPQDREDYNEDENQYEGQNEGEDEDQEEDNDEGNQNRGILYFWSGDFHPESIDRIYHYPLIQYTSNYLLDYYNDVKNSNRLMRFVLERFVERNFRFVAFTPFTRIVLSIATRVGRPILIRLDNFACNQLDALEDSQLALLPYYLVDKSLDITEGTLDFWLPPRGKHAFEFESENEGRLDLEEDFAKLDQEGKELDAMFARLRYLRFRAENLASNMKMRMRDRLGVVPGALPVSDFIGARLIGVLQLAHNIMNTPRNLVMVFERVRNNVLDRALSIGKQTLVLMWMVASPVLHLAHESGITLRDSVYNAGNRVSSLFDWASTHMLPESLRIAARRLMLLFKNFVTTGRLNWRKVKKTIREAPLATDLIEDKKGKSRQLYGDQYQEEYGGENEYAMEGQRQQQQGGRKESPLKLFEPKSEPAQETPKEEGEGEQEGFFEGQRPLEQQGKQGLFKEDISKQKEAPGKQESMSEQHLMSASDQEQAFGKEQKKGDLPSASQQVQQPAEGKKDISKEQKKDIPLERQQAQQPLQRPAQEKPAAKGLESEQGKEQKKGDIPSASQQVQQSAGGKQDLSKEQPLEKKQKKEDISSESQSAAGKKEKEKDVSETKKEDLSSAKETFEGKQDLSKEQPLEKKKKEDVSAKTKGEEATPLLQDIHPQALPKQESYAPKQAKKDQLDRMEPKPHLGQEQKKEQPPSLSKKETSDKSQKQEPVKAYSEALTQPAPPSEEKPSYAAVATGEASPSDIRKTTESQQQQQPQEPKSYAAVAKKAEPVSQQKQEEGSKPSYAAALTTSQPLDDSSKARGEKKDLGASLSKSGAFGEQAKNEDKSLSKEHPTTSESGEGTYHAGNVREKLKMFEGLTKGDKSAVFGK